MRPDPGRTELAVARRDWSVRERLALAAELRDRAFDIAWAALREREAAAGRLDDLERARFVLSRLYPELAGPRLDDIMASLAARRARGAWNGFTPPESFLRAGGLR
jgi:hypothetical protein